MAKLKIGAAEFRRLTGISAETLRHYADLGVFDGVEVAPNNYKKYDARNVVDALHARMCRGIDLGLSQIIHKAEFALDEQESLLVDHEARLKAEALELDLKLGRVRQQIECLSFARANLGKVIERSEGDAPSLYRLMLLGGKVGDDRARLASASRVVEHWMAHPQYPHVAIRASLASLLDPSVGSLPMEVGLGVRSEYASLLKLDTRPPVEFFPSLRNLGTVIAVPDPLDIKKTDIQGLLSRAEAIGAQISSDLVGRLCSSIETDRGRLYYFTASVCIK